MSILGIALLIEFIFGSLSVIYINRNFKPRVSNTYRGLLLWAIFLQIFFTGCILIVIGY